MTSYQLANVTVTPEIARQWLDTQPDRQRKINSAYAQRLADDMLCGQFQQSPQPFILDRFGRLLDGQHRATAICLAETALENAVVVSGVDPDLFGVIDIGMRRTPAQFIEGRNGSLLATAARLSMVYEADPELHRVAQRIAVLAIADVVQYVESNPIMVGLAAEAALVSRATKINAPSLLAVTSLGARFAPERVDGWIFGLTTGADLTLGDPRLTLRNTFLSSYRTLNLSTGRRKAWAYIVKAWNAWALDDSVKLLKQNPNEPWPRILSNHN